MNEKDFTANELIVASTIFEGALIESLDRKTLQRFYGNLNRKYVQLETGEMDPPKTKNLDPKQVEKLLEFSIEKVLLQMNQIEHRQG